MDSDSDDFVSDLGEAECSKKGENEPPNRNAGSSFVCYMRCSREIKFLLFFSRST